MGFLHLCNRWGFCNFYVFVHTCVSLYLRISLLYKIWFEQLDIEIRVTCLKINILSRKLGQSWRAKYKEVGTHFLVVFFDEAFSNGVCGSGAFLMLRPGNFYYFSWYSGVGSGVGTRD